MTQQFHFTEIGTSVVCQENLTKLLVFGQEIFTKTLLRYIQTKIKRYNCGRPITHKRRLGNENGYPFQA